MDLRKILLGCLLFGMSLQAASLEADINQSEALYIFEDRKVEYEPVTGWGWLTSSPGNVYDFVDQSFSMDNMDNLLYVSLSTAVLVYYDQSIATGLQEFGREQGISTTTSFDADVTAFPKDFGEFMYFIGDGRIPLMTSAFLAAYGATSDDVRAVSTSSQLLEMFVSVGMVVQGVKISTGRQTPNHATQAGGVWNGPTNPVDYWENKAQYDAVPSGHMATAVGMLTIMAENYREYRTEIYSYGSIFMGMLAFQMVNNGVHWAGDYPLAIALGYGMGNIIYDRNTKTDKNDQSKPYHNKLGYLLLPTDDGFMAALEYKF
jgi:hypothetical protein